MHTQSNFYAEQALVREIRRVASLFPGFTGDSHQAEPPLILDESYMSLDLPFPHDVLAPIMTMSLPNKIRQQLINCFTSRLNELRGRFLTIFQQTSTMARSIHDLDAIRQGVQSIYTRQCLPLFREQLSRLTESAKPQKQSHTGRKRTFNNEYTPLLEKYFEHNAYPSVSDRLTLARKSTMTSRQIEVWFQNHRNRAKKEGKILQRSSSTLPLQLSLNSLEVNTSLFAVSQQERLVSDDDDDSSEDSAVENLVFQPASSVDGFSSLAPPHAFPTPYPPNCVDDPFPNDNGKFLFAPPVWRRGPAASQPQSVPVDFDEFVTMFASKLNLQDDCLSAVQSKRKAHNPPLTDHKPWFAATITVASRAPHPAFVRQLQPLPTVASPTSKPFSQISLYSRSRSTTPTTPSLCQSSLKPRKLTPLPHRTPNTNSSTGCILSASIQKPTMSRVSSVSSATSSRSRSTSSSSLTEPVWSSPITQPQIATDDMFEAFHDYINQPRWTDLGFASTALTKQVSPFSLHRSSTLLPITDSSYLKVQS